MAVMLCCYELKSCFLCNVTQSIHYLGIQKTAKVTVLANDSPYGVVRWERTTYTVVEPDGSDTILILFILREQGLTGDLQVTYRCI